MAHHRMATHSHYLLILDYKVINSMTGIYNRPLCYKRNPPKPILFRRLFNLPVKPSVCIEIWTAFCLIAVNLEQTIFYSLC